MPIPANRLKIVVEGTIGGVQTWSTSLNCGVNLTGGSWALDRLTAVLPDLETYFETWATAVHGVWSPDTSFLGIKGYWYSVPGDNAEFYSQVTRSTPIVGAGSTPLPTFVSLVTSLLTPNVGGSYRGRSYLPLTAADLDANHQVSSQFTTTVCSAYQALINSLNAYTNPTQNLADMSVVVASAAKSVLTPITRVRTDSLPDTQHRRENAFSAEHTALLAVTA